MSTIGNIAVPEIPLYGPVFPIVSDFGFGRAHQPVVVEHVLGPNSADGKVSQRYYIGSGAKVFTVRRSALTVSQRQALADFWFANRGCYGQFVYHCPEEDGTTTDYICRFKDSRLTFEHLVGYISTTGVELVEIPTSNPSYSVTSEVLRLGNDVLQDDGVTRPQLLPSSLETSLTQQVQEIIPLISIQPLDADYPTMYLSDRRCVVGDQQYEPRLVDWAGIEQSLDGASDQASFTFGNSDKVFTQIANQVDLFRADVKFSLYHVGSGTKLNLWRGTVSNWHAGASLDTFRVEASDSFFELNQLYPRRKISRTCWKVFNDAGNGCPFSDEGQLYSIRSLNQSDGKDKSYTFQPDASFCDKSFDGANGCLAHGMERRFGGIIAHAQTVVTKDNSTGHFGFGRSPLTSTSLIADSLYGEVVPEVFCNITHADLSVGFPMDGKVAAGRDEGDFYNAIAVVCEGPLVEWAQPRPFTIVYDGATNTIVAAIAELTGLETPFGPHSIVVTGYGSPTIINHKIENKDDVEKAIGRSLKDTETFSLAYNPHKLDGQDHHGFVSDAKNNYGLRLVDGYDPVPHSANDSKPQADGYKYNFSLGEGGDGVQRWGPETAAGTAFIEIRRKDDKGLQLSRLQEHAVQTAIRRGLKGWVWNSDGTRAADKVQLTNPIWIAVNVVIRARGLFSATAEEQEDCFDVTSAVRAAAICDLQVDRLIGTGKETQFTFTGVMRDSKPARDWLQEILANCLGYYTFAFGKLKFGIRGNSSTVEQFSDGNIISGSLEYEPLRPGFWQITGHFSDEEFGYVANTVDISDETYGLLVGGVPMKSEINYAGASSKSQVARLITTRLREEIGGWRTNVQKISRRGSFRTTLLGLTVEPGTVCSISHEDLPDYPATADGSSDPADARSNYVELRIQRWKLNKDYSVEVEWRSVHNEIYDLVAGPKPADVPVLALPKEETFKPGDWRFYAYTKRDGLLRLNRIAVGTNKDTVHRGTFEVYYVNEATNAYGTCVGSLDDSQTTFTMSGHPPVEGRYILIDQELMYVETYTPSGDTNFGDVLVRRGQLGTTAAAHSRIYTNVLAIDSDNHCQLRVASGLGVKPGTRWVAPSTEQYGIASYDTNSGDAFTTLPLESISVGTEIYADPRLWIVDLKQEEVPFQARFFSSANRANWEHTIDMKNAGVVLIRGRVQNTRGIWSDYVYVVPTGGDGMDPQSPGGYQSEWPYRIRTLGGHMFQFPAEDLPVDTIENAFPSVRTGEAQPFERAYVDVTGGDGDPLPSPSGITAIVPTELRASGTVTLGGTVDEHCQVEIWIEGDNELQIPVWNAVDHPEATDLSTAAEAIRDWLNGDEPFASFYSASASSSVISITAKTGSAGTIVTDVKGTITATAAGMVSSLGVMTGRKYAVAYRGGGYLSSLSPASLSTGPTGSAERIELRDIPASGDDRISEVWIYATPDGRDEPYYYVGTVPNGVTSGADTAAEASLSGGPQYQQAIQPDRPGPIKVTLKKNGDPWCNLFVRSDAARSNEIHGFALDPVSENAEITVDVENQSEIVDLSVVLQ